MDKRDVLVKEWIYKADHDIGIAKLALEHGGEFRDAICFHCQQAVEKYLKAYLIYQDINFRRTHNLTYLLDLINDEIEEISDDIYSKAEILESYAVEIRYPDSWYEPTPAETKEAYDIVLEFKEFVLSNIKFEE